MTGPLTVITPMLARLIPRLSSPFDGERLATLAAIERTLKARGLDYNDLAGALDGPEPAPRMIYRDRPTSASEPPSFYSRGADPDGLRRDLARVNRLLLAVERLSLKEERFLINVRRSLLGRCPLFSKQVEWLDAIYARAALEYA